MYGIYVYDEKDIREQLTSTLMEWGKLSKPTDDDVDACSEYLYDKFAETFYESIGDFIDENWDRFEGRE